MRNLLHNRFVRVAVAVGVIALIGVGAILLKVVQPASQVQQGASQYRSAKVVRGDIRETVSATGPVEAKERSHLSFLLSGSVAEVDVVEGQRVQKGDLLMKLDTSQYELDLANAQLTVELQQIAYNQLVTGANKFDIAAARAAISRSAAQLAQLTSAPNEDTVRLAQTSYELAQSNLWRAEAGRDQVVGLYQAGKAAQHQVDEANKDVESAELSVKIAEQQLLNAQQGVSSQDIAAARANLAQSQASLNRLLEEPTETDVELARVQIEQAKLSIDSARLTIDNAALTAPFAGIIGEVNFQTGEQVAPGQSALLLLGDSAYHIDLLVDEVDIARVTAGQIAFVRLDAAPSSALTGHVSRIAPDGITVRGVVSYEVRIELDPSDLPIKDGMTATVDIIVSELTNILVIPNWAIRFDRKTGDAFVNIRRDDGTIEEIQVKIGTRGESTSEVIEGLVEGDEVVVSLDRQNPFTAPTQSP